MSTGAETYKVEVFKLPQNNTWTNVAIRWEPFKYDDHDEFEEAKSKPDFDEDTMVDCNSSTIWTWFPKPLLEPSARAFSATKMDWILEK